MPMVRLMRIFLLVRTYFLRLCSMIIKQCNIILCKQLSGHQPINRDWSSYSNRTTPHLSVDHESLFVLDNILLNYFGIGYINITTE